MSLEQAKFSHNSIEQAIERFAFKQPAVLVVESETCWLAQQWLENIHQSWKSRNTSAIWPTWFVEYFQWGPCHWPLTWSDIVKLDTLDCGSLAALTTYSLTLDQQIVYQVQIVKRYTSLYTSHWMSLWHSKGCATDWIYEEFVYHEVVAVCLNNTLYVWDPSFNRVINPKSVFSDSFDSVAAIKIVASSGDCLTWGSLSITPNCWMTGEYND